MKLRCGAGLGRKSPGTQRRSREARGEKAKVHCDREKPTESSPAGCRLTRAQQGFLLLYRNEASLQPAASVRLLDGLNAGLIRLHFQERGGGLSRKEITVPGRRLLRRQDLE